LSFAADVLPLGYTLEADTGLFTGTLTSADLPLDVTITATNTRGSVSHTVTWNTWDALGAAQAWYDTTPSTLKTDLVASFTQANAESLSLYTPLGHELHPSGEFTFSTWVKGAAGGVGSTQNIIENFASNVGGYRLMALGDGRLYWELTTQAYEIDGSLDGNWQFLTLGWDGSNMVTSINGVVTKFSKTTPLQGPTRDFRLGRDADFDMGPTGAWGRALTSAEITAVYNSGTPRSYANMTTAEKVSLVSFWNLWEPRGTRYDSHGTNHLTDINTVGAAQGPVEIQAGEYAGVTKWENQGLAASPFGDVAINAPGDAPQFIGGVLVYDVLSNALRTASGETLGDSTIVFVGSKDAAAPSDAYAVDSNNPAFRRILYVPSGKYRAYSNGVLSWASGAITDRVLVFASFTSTDVTLQVAADVFATGTGTTEAMKGLSVGGINSLSSAYNWVGTIDSVIVFGRLLTATEKAALTAHFALA